MILIHKKGDKTQATNHRPISLLSQFDKIFEKLIYHRIDSFIGKYHLLSDKQFGFRRNLSTSHAIGHIHDNLIRNADSGLYTYCIFFDLYKAFDTVDHELLFKKL